MPSWKKVITSGSDVHLKTINTDGNISGSSVSTGSFGRVEATTSVFTNLIENVAGSSLKIKAPNNDIILDTGDNDIQLYAGGSEFARLTNDSNTLAIKSSTSNADIVFNGVDSGANITALRLDMSEAGKAIFNSDVSGSSVSTGSFGRVETSTISGLSPLIIESDNVNVDSDGSVSGSSVSTGSFGKIEATTLKGTLETAAQGNVTSLGTLTTLTVDDITLNGSTISDGGDLTLDIGGDLNIDVDGTDIILKDGGTAFGRFKRDSSDFIIKSEANNEDIILRGQDAGSTIDALLLDMSEGGDAYFNNDISGSTIRASGDIIAFNSSDERLKDNVEPIKFPLDKLGKIGGYTFDWNDKQQIYHGHDVGVLAQEIEEVLPEAVKDRGSGYKGVQYDKIIPLLIEGIKELKEKVKHIEENCDCLKK